MNQIKALFAGSLALALAAAGCLGETRLHADDDDDDDSCAQPAPPATGWCPPAWTCLDGEWVNTAGACPDPCPAERPLDGTACPAVGLSCPYDEEWYDCGEPDYTTTVDVQCTTTGWLTATYRCLPPPECPDVVPVNGSDCSDWFDAYYCDYSISTACGDLGAYAACMYDENGPVWEVSLYETCDSCADLDSAAGCSANPDCRWLEPGCDEQALQTAGCFPAADCAEGACDGGLSCTTVAYDPCWNSDCDACAAQADVCL